jgi:hypothetical protein
MLGYIFGDFFKNSSGHPVHYLPSMVICCSGSEAVSSMTGLSHLRLIFFYARSSIIRLNRLKQKLQDKRFFLQWH